MKKLTKSEKHKAAWIKLIMLKMNVPRSVAAKAYNTLNAYNRFSDESDKD